MATAIIPKWQIVVTITRVLEYPIEDNENKGEIRKWASSPEGKRFIQVDFIKHLNCYSYPKNADMEVEEVELKEYEVKSTDTDTRV